MARDPRDTAIWTSSKLVVSVISNLFVGYNTMFWRPGTISMARDPPIYRYLDVVKTRRFEHFWPFSWGSGRFRWPVTPGTRPVTPGTRPFRRRQNSSFPPFMAIYVCYSTMFWCPGKIQMARDPRDTAIWTSSKLVVLDISDHFRGLFGRRQNSSLRSFMTIFVRYRTLFWRPGTISMSRDPRYTAIWTSSKLVVSSNGP